MFAWFHCGGPRSRQVDSDSRRFTRARLGFVGFIRFRMGSIWRARCRRVHSGSRRFTRARLVVVGFIQVGSRANIGLRVH